MLSSLFPVDRLGRPGILQMIDSGDEAADELTVPIEYGNAVVRFPQLTSPRVWFFVCAIAVSAVLLIVLITLVGSSSAVLPSQCFAYTNLAESTRLVTHTSCCHDDNSLTSGWHRFTGNAGTRLATSPLSQSYACGGNYPGWWNGTLPTKRGSTTMGNVCFYQGTSTCDSTLSPISATNCGDYYVFYLIAPKCCGNFRYCSTS